MSGRGATIVEVQAKVFRDGARPEAFGWKITFEPNEDPAQAAATITDVCRRIRDETQEKIR